MAATPGGTEIFEEVTYYVLTGESFQDAGNRGDPCCCAGGCHCCSSHAGLHAAPMPPAFAMTGSARFGVPCVPLDPTVIGGPAEAHELDFARPPAS